MIDQCQSASVIFDAIHDAMARALCLLPGRRNAARSHRRRPRRHFDLSATANSAAASSVAFANSHFLQRQPLKNAFLIFLSVKLIRFAFPFELLLFASLRWSFDPVCDYLSVALNSNSMK